MDTSDKLKSIIKGWSGFISKKTTPQIKARASICSSCPHAVQSKFMTWIGDDITEVEGLVCGLCHCPLSAKIRSEDESCDDGRW